MPLFTPFFQTFQSLGVFSAASTLNSTFGFGAAAGIFQQSRSPVWKGSQAIALAPNCPIWEDGKDGPKVTLIYNGPYATLYGNPPARLGAMADAPSGFFIDSVRIEKSPGGKGTMTVMLGPAPVADYSFASDPRNTTLEIDWIEVQTKLELHPIFRPAGENPDWWGPSGQYELAKSDLSPIEAWKSAPTDDNYNALSDNAKHFADKIAKGTDSFVHYAPVVKRTRKSLTQPQTGKCGYIEEPPEPLNLPGYQFLKTADRATRDKTWTQVEEWTGALSIDIELYPYS